MDRMIVDIQSNSGGASFFGRDWTDQSRPLIHTLNNCPKVKIIVANGSGLEAENPVPTVVFEVKKIHSHHHLDYNTLL